MLDREDMLELTRRMTLKRNCFTRIAGSYMDADGFSDGTFNIHFLKLTAKEQSRNIQMAKTVPFSGTNYYLKEYEFPNATQTSKDMHRLLNELNTCGLKNDAALDTFYELIGDQFQANDNYCIYVFHGTYDIPVKASDKERTGDSEEVYDFLICTIGPVDEDYNPGKPEWGFLYPSFADRSRDPYHIAIFDANPAHPHMELVEGLMGCDPFVR